MTISAVLLNLGKRKIYMNIVWNIEFLAWGLF